MKPLELLTTYFAHDKKELLDMLINARKHSLEVTKLGKIKELLLSHMTGKQENDLKALKVRCLMEKRLLENRVKGSKKYNFKIKEKDKKIVRNVKSLPKHLVARHKPPKYISDKSKV